MNPSSLNNPSALAFKNVTKRFGSTVALNNLSFEIPQGSTCAFIGANGAGKTTSFSLVGGFLRRFKGQVDVGGISLRNFRSSGGVIGLMPQDVQCFQDRTILSQLELFSRLAGRSPMQAHLEIDELLTLTDMQEHRHKEPAQLSHGMRIRFGIAQAFIGEPKVVLLDEPTAGLDPVHLDQIRSLLMSVRGRTTLVVSSHDLNELQSWCDYVVMIEKGQCIRQGLLKDILGRGQGAQYVIEGKYQLSELEKAFPEVRFTQRDRYLNVSGAINSAFTPALMAWLESRGCQILSFDRQGSLEQAYLSQVQK